ncbi:MAG: hypothetical protein ACYS22_07370 [Planctomycetota bacterium]|jgi:hypothetical protein
MAGSMKDGLIAGGLLALAAAIGAATVLGNQPPTAAEAVEDAAKEAATDATESVEEVTPAAETPAEAPAAEDGGGF